MSETDTRLISGLETLRRELLAALGALRLAHSIRLYPGSISIRFSHACAPNHHVTTTVTYDALIYQKNLTNALRSQIADCFKELEKAR